MYYMYYHYNYLIVSCPKININIDGGSVIQKGDEIGAIAEYRCNSLNKNRDANEKKILAQCLPTGQWTFYGNPSCQRM